MATKRTPKTGYMAQCMNLGRATVGQNMNLIPYNNERAARDHIAHHVKVGWPSANGQGCTRAHQVRSFTI